MTYRSIAILILGAVVVAGASPSAHHAASVAYHVDKEITVQGVVTEVKWENPHTWVYVEAKDASGKVVKWSFEARCRISCTAAASRQRCSSPACASRSRRIRPGTRRRTPAR